MHAVQGEKKNALLHVQEQAAVRVPLKDVTAEQTRVAPSIAAAARPEAAKLAAAPARRDEVQRRNGPRIVSLGSYCGVRKSVQKADLDGESLPFDWMRTRVEGILHYLRNDFDMFFNYVTTHDLQNSVVMYRDHLHSFWHDDLLDPQCKEKYQRRIERLFSLDARTEPILFIRSVAHTRELLLTDELLQEITKRFGERAKLMVIVDFQAGNVGPALVQDRENLLVYSLPTKAHQEPYGAPYGDPIKAALDWMDGCLQGARVLPSVNSLLDGCDIRNGWSIDGLDPFEELCGSSTASVSSSSSSLPTTTARPTAYPSGYMAAPPRQRAVPMTQQVQQVHAQSMASPSTFVQTAKDTRHISYAPPLPRPIYVQAPVVARQTSAAFTPSPTPSWTMPRQAYSTGISVVQAGAAGTRQPVRTVRA